VPALVSDWFARWSEPVRLRSRHAAADHFQRNAAWFGIATSPFLRDWFRPPSEPVRSKPPLPRAAVPAFFAIINYVNFSFAITETGDTISMTIAEYVLKKGLARVSISERKGPHAIVNITDARDGIG